MVYGHSQNRMAVAQAVLTGLQVLAGDVRSLCQSQAIFVHGPACLYPVVEVRHAKPRQLASVYPVDPDHSAPDPQAIMAEEFHEQRLLPLLETV